MKDGRFLDYRIVALFHESICNDSLEDGGNVLTKRRQSPTRHDTVTQHGGGGGGVLDTMASVVTHSSADVVFARRDARPTLSHDAGTSKQFK